MRNWYFDIVRVKQVDWNGCAIASVAAVCGVSYHRARHEFFPDVKVDEFVDDSRLWVDQTKMAEVIDRLGFDASIEPVTSFSRLKKARVPAIMCFSWCASIGARAGVHSIVWDPFHGRFIDPGPDSGSWEVEQYVKMWRASNYQTIVVTGKKNVSAAA